MEGAVWEKEIEDNLSISSEVSDITVDVQMEHSFMGYSRTSKVGQPVIVPGTTNPATTSLYFSSEKHLTARMFFPNSRVKHKEVTLPLLTIKPSSWMEEKCKPDFTSTFRVTESGSQVFSFRGRKCQEKFNRKETMSPLTLHLYLDGVKWGKGIIVLESTKFQELKFEFHVSKKQAMNGFVELSCILVSDGDAKNTVAEIIPKEISKGNFRY